MNHDVVHLKRVSKRAALLWVMVASACLTGCDKSDSGQASATQAVPPGWDPTPIGVSTETVMTSLSAAQQYIMAGDTDKAKAILLTLIEKVPTSSPAHEFLGQVYVLEGQAASKRNDARAKAEFTAKAYEEYKKAVEYDPNSAGLAHAAGMIAMAAEDIEGAAKLFQKAGTLAPASVQHPLFEGQALLQLGRNDEAAVALKRALALDPDQPYVLSSLAVIASNAGRLGEAEDYLKKAREAAPNDLNIRVQEARIHRTNGMPRRSLELLTALPPAEQTKDVVVLELAEAYYMDDQPIKTAQLLETYVQSHPFEAEKWKRLVRIAECMIKLDQLEQAAMWMYQAKAEASDEPEVKTLEETISSLLAKKNATQGSQ